MAVSKSQQKASNKYIAENYDKTTLAMRKGIKEVWQTEAKKRNLSFNAFIQYCVAFTVKQENEVYLTSNGLTAEYCIIKYSKEFKTLKEVKNMKLEEFEKAEIFKFNSKEGAKEYFNSNYRKTNKVNQLINGSSVSYVVELYGLESRLIDVAGNIKEVSAVDLVYDINKLTEDF